MIYFLYISTLVFILIREYFFIIERKDWLSERQKLLDRIQSKDLPEYKAMERPKETKKTEDKDKKYEFL